MIAFMKCPNCGNHNFEDAQFCSLCGQPLPEAAPQPEPGAEAPGYAVVPADPQAPKRGITTILSTMVSSAFSRRGLGFFPRVIGAYILVYAVSALGTVLSVYAALGTLSFHRIVNTSCFVKTGSSDEFFLNTGGAGSSTRTNYKLLPHCDWFPLSINWGLLVLVAAISIVVALIVSAAALIYVARLADRFSSDSERKLMPTIPETGRALGRWFGWSITIYLAVVVAVAVIAGIFAVCGALLPEAITVIVAIAAGVAFIYALIRYLVPWYVRAGFTLMIVLADDRPARPVWRETVTPATTAWAFVGILLLIGIVTGIAGQIAGAIMGQGSAVGLAIGAVLYLVVTAVQIGFQLLFTMMVARQAQRGWS